MTAQPLLPMNERRRCRGHQQRGSSGPRGREAGVQGSGGRPPSESSFTTLDAPCLEKLQMSSSTRDTFSKSPAIEKQGKVAVVTPLNMNGAPCLLATALFSSPAWCDAAIRPTVGAPPPTRVITPRGARHAIPNMYARISHPVITVLWVVF